MGTIDKQRISAVVKLEELGYAYSLADGWTAPGTSAANSTRPFTAEPDAMHAVLISRADGGVDAADAVDPRRWQRADLALYILLSELLVRSKGHDTRSPSRQSTHRPAVCVIGSSGERWTDPDLIGSAREAMHRASRLDRMCAHLTHMRWSDFDVVQLWETNTSRRSGRDISLTQLPIVRFE
jgi:hypothetical protein